MTHAYNSLSSDLLPDTSLQFQALHSSDHIISHQCVTPSSTTVAPFSIFPLAQYLIIVLTYILCLFYYRIIVHCVFILCTSLHLLQTAVLTFDILYWPLFYFIIQLWILTKTNMIFKLWSDLYNFNYIWVLVLTTLKMATWVVKMCLWPLCNKITSIKSKCICWYFNICCAPVTVLELKMEKSKYFPYCACWSLSGKVVLDHEWYFSVTVIIILFF